MRMKPVNFPWGKVPCYSPISPALPAAAKHSPGELTALAPTWDTVQEP